MDGGNLAPLKIPDALYFLGYKVYMVVQDSLHPPYFIHEPQDHTVGDCRGPLGGLVLAGLL